MRGRFIVFEGLDGSGTTTQAALLCACLRGIGHRAVQTSEPTLGPVGVLIRHILSGRSHVSTDDDVVRRQLAFLFAADRHDHLHNDMNGILKLVNEGVDVLSTRYYLSSLAYNAASTDDLEYVLTLNQTFPAPDITFLVECSVEECVRRIAADLRSYDRHENASMLEQVAEGYSAALGIYPGTVKRIDGERDPELVHADVIRALSMD